MSLKKILNGYRGGIDFKYLSQGFYILDDNIKLSLDLPICNPIKPQKAKLVNYPLSREGWFEANYNQMGHSKYIPIHEAYWFYWPIVPTPFRGELGNLRLNISISKLSSPELSVDKLGKAVLEEYNDYYNSSEIGKYLKGVNTKLIDSANEHLARRGVDISEKERNELIDFYINKTGFPVIDEFENIKINNNDWVKYLELRSEGRKKKYVYATFLSNELYLLVEFVLVTNMSHSGKNWYKEAEAAIPRLMEGIKLEFLSDTERA